jgi:hypothetical protein
VIFFSFVLLIGYCVRIWISGFSGVHPDEAYYWAWSLRPDLGYVDHPPLIAWLISFNRVLVNSLFPDSLMEAFPVFFAQLKLRALPYFVSSVATPLILGYIVEAVQRSPLLLSQMFCLITLPLAFLGPVVVTPDSIFFFAWTLALGFGIAFQKTRKIKSIAGDPTPLNLSLSILTGVSMAIAVYSGQLAFLIPLLLIVSGIGLRNWLVSVFVGALLSTPYLLWISSYSGTYSDLFYFVPQDTLPVALQSMNRWPLWKNLWTSQFILWSPVIFAACFIYLVLDQRRFFLYDQNSRFTGTLFLWAFLPLVFITAFAFRAPIDANWGLMGAIPASVLVLARFKFRPFWRTMLLFTNIVLVTGALLLFTMGKELAPQIEQISPTMAQRLSRRSRIDEFRNWRNLHLLLSTTLGGDSSPIVIPDRQTLASLIFSEESAAKTQRFGNRLKTLPSPISPSGSSVGHPNFFQRQHEYLFDLNTQARFWYFSKDRPAELKNCRASQSLERIPGETYWLLLCNES